MKEKKKLVISIVLALALVITSFTSVTAQDTPLIKNSDSSLAPLSAMLSDGVYKPEEFTVSGGTGKVTITCPKITITNGKAVATIVFSSMYYTAIEAGEVVYKGEIDEASKTSTYEIPITLNEENTIIGTTTAMSEAHQITYVIKAELGGSSQVISDKETLNVKDGDYKINADTDNRMFYIALNSENEKTALLKKNGDDLTVTIVLTGKGYDYLYLGTIKEAENADKTKWIPKKTVNGYYTYTFSISKFDENLKIAAHSKNRDQWYQHTIIFYSKEITRVKEDTTKEKVSVASKDTEKTTASVNNETSLKDGVYTPDKVSWSGGSGRLAYIDCSKITVTNGKAYATIVFSSPSYDSLKASGRTYTKRGSGLSTFVIPVNLNKNNTIVGRTVAMSQAHWITYSIYIYLEAAETENGAIEKKSQLSKDELEIMGLTYKSEVKVEHAKYFKLYNYNDGIKLLQIDISKDTELSFEGKKESENTQTEITEGLYRNKIVNYLIVPEGAEIPAGLDKEYIIVNLPIKDSYALEDGTADYRALVKNKTKLAFLSSTVIPEKIVKSEVFWLFRWFKIKEMKEEAAEKQEKLEKLETGYATLGIPLIIDRSSAEKDPLGELEWVKVYKAIFGN